MHGKSSSSTLSYASQTFSLSLVNVSSGSDISVAGLATPISIALPVDGRLLASSCTGQPSESGVLDQLQSGTQPCTRAVECRYWCAMPKCQRALSTRAQSCPVRTSSFEEWTPGCVWRAVGPYMSAAW